MPGIAILAGSLNTDPAGVLAAPVGADLIAFALTSRVDS
jgi:hypothetical protein